MKLTKEQFVEHVTNLTSMLKDVNDLVLCLHAETTIMDDWFDGYYHLVD